MGVPSPTRVSFSFSSCDSILTLLSGQARAPTLHSDLEPVEPGGVFRKDLLFQTGRHMLLAFEDADGIYLAGWVAVAIIRPNHHNVVAAIFGDVRNVVVGL